MIENFSEHALHGLTWKQGKTTRWAQVYIQAKGTTTLSSDNWAHLELNGIKAGTRYGPLYQAREKGGALVRGCDSFTCTIALVFVVHCQDGIKKPGRHLCGAES